MQRLMDVMVSGHRQFMDVLEAARTRRGGFFRNVTLVTSGDGPDVRTVVLREISPGLLVVFTDRRSPKFSQLQDDDRAAIHAYDQKTKLQVRGYGTCQLVTGDKIPQKFLREAMQRREDYAGFLSPGEKLDAGQAWDMDLDQASQNLALILFKPHLWDVLELHVEGHRRFGWNLEDGEWVGSWRAP